MNVPECLVKLAPTWAERIRKATKLTDLYEIFDKEDSIVDYPLIDSSMYCIVGEAHGFSSFYAKEKMAESEEGIYCDECDGFALQFAAAINPENTQESYGVEKPQDFDKLVNQFCQHMKNDHGRKLN